jgi:Zn-dependent M28 family amino/carboxypeptidase
MIPFAKKESGYLGSQYYVQNKPRGQQKTVANINLDGFNRYGKTNDVALIIPGRNSLEEMFQAELTKQGRKLTPKPEPADHFYFRSDQLIFGKAGVPVLFAFRCTDYFEGGAAYETIVRKNFYGYHTPNDEYNEAWRFDGTFQDMELYYQIGLGIIW